MKARRVAMDADIQKYEMGKGMEDGFELFIDVVTHGWISTEHLIQYKREDGKIVTPYINHRRGRIFICEGDYIVTDADGTRHVVGGDKAFQRYEPME